VIWSKSLLPNRHRALNHRLGLGVITFFAVDNAEIVEGVCYIRVFGP
jgi:hypothetical protein